MRPVFLWHITQLKPKFKFKDHHPASNQGTRFSSLVYQHTAECCHQAYIPPPSAAPLRLLSSRPWLLSGPRRRPTVTTGEHWKKVEPGETGKRCTNTMTYPQLYGHNTSYISKLLWVMQLTVNFICSCHLIVKMFISIYIGTLKFVKILQSVWSKTHTSL